MFTRPKALIAAVATALSLAACVNDGTVADKHAITFEEQLPAAHPTQAQLETGLRQWIIERYADGASVRDVTLGPVRYARLLIPFPDRDFFSCVQFTAKNQYGTYMPPTRLLVMFRDYDKNGNYRVGIAKQPGTGAYDQYCLSQSHG